ncbi:unnamed protein product [Calypogeia fissa]
MAKVPLQAYPSSTVFREPKPSDFVKLRLREIDRQLNSASVSNSSGVGNRGRGIGARSLRVLEDFTPTRLCEEKSRIKKNQLEWCVWRSWSGRGGTKREAVVRALDGDFSSRENAQDTSLEKVNGDRNYRSFFRDQVYDYDRGNDLYVDNSIPEEGVRGLNGEVGKFIRNEGLEEPFNAQRDPEERMPGVRSREWAQLDDEGRRSEASVSETKEARYSRDLDDVRQRPSQTQGLSYPANPIPESRLLLEDRKQSQIDFRKARDYDDVYESRGSQPYELEAVEARRSPPAGDFVNRYGFQSDGKDEVSEIEDHEQQGQVLPKSGSTGRERTSSTEYGREAEHEKSARGLMYAKQVISLATAQSVGFVTQLWVDVENVCITFPLSLKVVAIEVRPSLLFGDFYSFPLNSISKVGDVVLIQDDDTILGRRDLFNCSDLVGNDLFTEDGIKLGKVRDYNFSLENGEVVSIEYDSFGIPLIPSSLTKTYSLAVDEVIETQEDSLLVRRGAENRVRKLSKGFRSRTKKSSEGRPSPWRQQRNQAPEIQYLGQSTERIHGVTEERDNYTPGYSTPRQQPQSGNVYSAARRGLVNESLGASRNRTNLYPSSSFSSRSKDLNPEEFEDYQTIPSTREELPITDKPQILENDPTQGSDFGISSPEMSGSGRGLPMSYRTSRRRVENDY